MSKLLLFGILVFKRLCEDSSNFALLGLGFFFLIRIWSIGVSSLVVLILLVELRLRHWSVGPRWTASAWQLLLLIVVLVEFNWASARGTLHLLDDPSTEAAQVEEMTTREFLSTPDWLKANGALKFWLFRLAFDFGLVRVRPINVLQLSKLAYKLPLFVDLEQACGQPVQVVNDLTQQVDRQSSSLHNKEEEPHISCHI